MNELSVIGSLCCAKIFEIATGQTLQVARGKYMAKDCLEVQKYHFGDLFPAVKISYFVCSHGSSQGLRSLCKTVRSLYDKVI